MTKKLINSFRYALQGLGCALKEQQSFRIQLMVALAVTFLMFYLPLLSLERAVLFIIIFLVLSLELVNSIFEKTIDILKPEIHPQIRKIKDMMAGVVLVASIGSVIVGLIIFLPYLYF